MAGYSIFAETLADMTWTQVETAAKRGAVMLVPVAVIEQHGPHLPLATDTYGAYLTAVLIKRALAQLDQEALVAPPYYFGICESTKSFAGTMNARKDSMVALLTDCFANYQDFGFKRQYVLNHHGDPGHIGAVISAIRNARAQGIDAILTMGGFAGEFMAQSLSGESDRRTPLPKEALLIAEGSPETRTAREQVPESAFHCHAEERETGMIMRYFPETLNPEVDIPTLPPLVPAMEAFLTAARDGTWRELSPMGYIGDPALASPATGELYAYECRDIAKAIDRHLRTNPIG